jgi:hypothetical protein
MLPAFAPLEIAVIENEFGGTATTIGEGIEMPKTMLVEVLPAVGNTAAPAEVGAIVTATGKLFVFNNPA